MTKKIIIAAIISLFVFFNCFTVVCAAGEIVIKSVAFEEYTDEYGYIDESVVSVKIQFSSPSAKQITILLASENISEISSETKPKIIFMIQDISPADGVYVFTIEKSRICSAVGTENPDGSSLCLKMGGSDIADMTAIDVVYSEPWKSDTLPGDVDIDGEVTNLDGTWLLRYLVGWPMDNVSVEAMDVDNDGEITNIDGTYLLRYLAGWNIELK